MSATTKSAACGEAAASSCASLIQTARKAQDKELTMDHGLSTTNGGARIPDVRRVMLKLRRGCGVVSAHLSLCLSFLLLIVLVAKNIGEEKDEDKRYGFN